VPDEEEARRLRLGHAQGTRARLAASLRRAGRPAGQPAPPRPADLPAGAPRHVVESIEGARGDSGTSTEAMRWVPPDSPHRLRPTGA
jgi:hypothetical protein